MVRISRLLPLCFLVIQICYFCVSARAQPYFSIGPKIGYTWGGSESGAVFGIEVSYFYQQDFNTNFFYAITLDASVVNGTTFIVHTGYESLDLGIAGIDIGPTFAIRNGTISPGLGVIGFIGAVLYPFFEMEVYPWEQKSFAATVGGYLKFPLSPLPEVKFD
jgi:hypothetical protein